MAKHTPGPWFLEGSDGIFIGLYRETKYGATLIARICDYTLQKKANAQLIATAPDLLAALKEYQKANRLHNDEEGRLYYLAEQAIVKAEG